MESKAPIHKFLLVFLIILILFFIFYFIYIPKSETQLLTQAQNSYKEALNAPTVIQREEGFNRALDIYTTLEEQYHPTHGNGKLYTHIAATFFQLEQYPWAALNYYQAKALMPRDEEIISQLKSTLKKLHMDTPTEDSVFKKVFFFHTYLSLPERLQILSFCIFAGLGLASLYIWKKFQFMKSLIALVILAGMIFFISVIYTKYFEPLEGVIVQASMLYRETHLKPPFIDAQPLLEGSKIEILDVLEEGRWLKIRTSKGLIGFIPSESTRLIKI